MGGGGGNNPGNNAIEIEPPQYLLCKAEHITFIQVCSETDTQLKLWSIASGIFTVSIYRYESYNNFELLCFPMVPKNLEFIDKSSINIDIFNVCLGPKWIIKMATRGHASQPTNHRRKSPTIFSRAPGLFCHLQYWFAAIHAQQTKTFRVVRWEDRLIIFNTALACRGKRWQRLRSLGTECTPVSLR